MSEYQDVEINFSYDYDFEYMLSYARILHASPFELDVIISVFENNTDLYNLPIPPLSIKNEYESMKYLKNIAKKDLDLFPNFDAPYDYEWRRDAITTTFIDAEELRLIIDLWRVNYGIYKNKKPLKCVSYALQHDVLNKYINSVLKSLY